MENNVSREQNHKGEIMSQLKWITIMLLMGLASGCAVSVSEDLPSGGSFVILTSDAAYSGLDDAPSIKNFKVGDVVYIMVSNTRPERSVTLVIQNQDTGAKGFEEVVMISPEHPWKKLLRVTQAGLYYVQIKYMNIVLAQTKFIAD